MAEGHFIADPPDAPLANRIGMHLDGRHGLHRPLHLLIKQQTVGIGHQYAAVVLEKLEADTLLRCPDQMADSGLRHVHVGGGSAHRSKLDYRVEGFDLTLLQSAHHDSAPASSPRNTFLE